MKMTLEEANETMKEKGLFLMRTAHMPDCQHPEDDPFRHSACKEALDVCSNLAYSIGETLYSAALEETSEAISDELQRLDILVEPFSSLEDREEYRDVNEAIDCGMLAAMHKEQLLREKEGKPLDEWYSIVRSREGGT